MLDAIEIKNPFKTLNISILNPPASYNRRKRGISFKINFQNPECNFKSVETLMFPAYERVPPKTKDTQRGNNETKRLKQWDKFTGCIYLFRAFPRSTSSRVPRRYLLACSRVQFEDKGRSVRRRGDVLVTLSGTRESFTKSKRRIAGGVRVMDH